MTILMEPQKSNLATNNLGQNDLDWQKIAPYLSDDDDTELFYFLYQGLIFPKEENFMLRCRMTGAELTSQQLSVLADIAETHGAGHLDITTRANFQIRDIQFCDAIIVLKKLLNLDFIPAVKGLNNLRNVTITPTTGFDAAELTDVRPIAHKIFQQLLYNEDLQGLPGNFRFTAADIRGENTISQDFNWLVAPEHVVEVLNTIIKVYLQEGDFTKRLKSRIKFLIKQIGIDSFKSKVRDLIDCQIIDDEITLGYDHTQADAHIGVQDQQQPELCYIGVNGAAGRYTVDQIRLIASTSNKHGNDTIRLTTSQNCLIPYLKRADTPEIIQQLQATDLTVNSKIAGHVIACTGSAGCSFSATTTKAHSLALSKYLEENGEYNESINIHFTGCSFSCAQTYIGDIGLIGMKSKGEECYHIFLGGGAESNTPAVRIWKAIPHEQVPNYVKAILDFYKVEKQCGENFNQFVHRFGAENFNQSIVLNG